MKSQLQNAMQKIFVNLELYLLSVLKTLQQERKVCSTMQELQAREVEEPID